MSSASNGCGSSSTRRAARDQRAARAGRAAVKLIDDSEDVIHGFFVPAFRVKQDVLPGRYTHDWFQATKHGKVSTCSAPSTAARTLGHDRHGRWCMEPTSMRSGSPAAVPPHPGKRSRRRASGSSTSSPASPATCRVGDGRGPSLDGLVRQDREARRAAARSSPTRPTSANRFSIRSEDRRRLQPIMPTFQGQLSEEQVIELLAYIKSLGPKQSGAVAAAAGSEGTQP